MSPASVQLTSSALPEEIPSWGVLVLESHHAQDFFMEWRTHSFLKILFFRSGDSLVHAGRKSFRCSGGDIVIVPAGIANRIEDQPGRAVSLYALCLAPVVFEFDRKLFSSISIAHHSLGTPQVREIENGLRRLRYLQGSRTKSTSASMVSIALGVFAELREDAHQMPGKPRKPTGREIIATHVARLEKHFVEAADIGRAAAEAGISRRYFTKLFREHTGKSWLDHVHDLRINHAGELLRKTQLSVATIAFECGYNDLSTFYRCFGKRMGASPQSWREQNGGVVTC